MFAAPNWEEIELFDSEDLTEDNVFVVYSNPASNEGHKEDEANFAFVWIGSENDADEDGALELGRKCLEAKGIECTDISVVLESDESKRFWLLFRDG